MSRIERRFVRVGDRDVHVRIAGAGPAVLLVHQSPQSSAALVPMIEALADEHLVIAPDTPGFGHSEPMGRAQPTIDDFASNLAALLAALGLERVAAWGVHTGASIATRLALLDPGRVALLVTDGLARFTEAERRPMLARYLPPFEPAWDGTHLLWLWARFREQLLYFPWNDDRAECRLAFDLPTPERTQRDVLDALAAGDGFRTGYRAPFLLDDPDGPGRLTVPAHLLYRRDDVLYPHAERLPPLPPNVTVERIENGQAGMLARLRELLAAHRGRCASGPVAESRPAAGALGRTIVASRDGDLSVRVRRGGAPTRVVLHDLGCAPQRSPELARVAPGETLIAPELPGHGASCEWTGPLDPESIADAIDAAIARHGEGPVRIVARGASAALALVLARRLGERLDEVVLDAPLPLTSEERATLVAGAPSGALHPTGAHLIEAWNWVRLGALFPRWWPPLGRHARRVAAPAPFLIEEDAVEMIRLGARLAPMLDAHLAPPLEPLASGLGARLVLRAPAGFELADRLAALVERLGARFAPSPSIGVQQ